MSDLKKRTITAIVLIALITPVVFFGKIFMVIFAGLLSVGATYELEKMFKKEDKWDSRRIANIVLSALSYSVIYYSIFLKEYMYIGFYLLLMFLYFGALMIFDKRMNIHNLGNSLLSIFYPAIGFSSLALIRNIETGLYREGLFVLIYAVLICMCTDMFAYFFGSKFGKHKLAPTISPKKSIEGSIAGTAFSIVIPPVFAILTNVHKVLFPNVQDVWAILLVILFSLVLSAIDEIGDLFASKLKREYEIKDYSQIFPGHGGILDRFDSYIFVGVCVLIILI